MGTGPKRLRLDRLLLERGLAETASRARALVMAGRVLVNGTRADKGGMQVAPDSETVLIPEDEYVSRGGRKLSALLDRFGLKVEGKVCLDVGASTGGFTDCLVKRGAAKVFAVDVGYGQFDWRLRNDPRVVLLEKTNARYLTMEQLGRPVELAVIDVSFISLAQIIPNIAKLVEPGGEILALIKPQFEVGKGQAKGGVVKDPGVHQQVIEKVSSFSEGLGLQVEGTFPSPLLGPKGNREFFIYLRRPP